MNSINKALPPINHGQALNDEALNDEALNDKALNDKASTSAAYSGHTLRPRRGIKRNLSSPMNFVKNKRPAKQRKVQSAEKPNASEQKRLEAKAKHLQQTEMLRIKKCNAIKYVEQWLNTKGVNTDSLKLKDTATEKQAQYEKKLLNFKDNDIVKLCQDSLDELADLLINFKLVQRPNKEQKKQKTQINIENLKQLVNKTKKLKEHIAVDKNLFAQFITLKNKVAKQFYYDNDNDRARTRYYAEALYQQTKSLMGDSLLKKEFVELNKNMALLEKVAGINQKPKLTRKEKILCKKEDRKSIKEAFSKLKTLLQKKYAIKIEKSSHLKLLYVAKENIDRLNQKVELPAKTYTPYDFKEICKFSNKPKGIRIPNKIVCQDRRNKKKELLKELQRQLNKPLLTQKNSIDIEKTILAACDFFEKSKSDSNLSTSTHEIIEEDPTAESIPVSISPGPEPEESACSSKNLFNPQKEPAYIALRETLKHWPVLSTLPEDNRELICAAEYCINSIYWKKPITDEAYQRYRLSQPVSKHQDDTPQDLINAQLESLKNILIDVSLHAEEVSKKQGVDIIRAANEYLNDLHESDYR